MHAAEWGPVRVSDPRPKGFYIVGIHERVDDLRALHAHAVQIVHISATFQPSRTCTNLYWLEAQDFQQSMNLKGLIFIYSKGYHLDTTRFDDALILSALQIEALIRYSFHSGQNQNIVYNRTP